MQRLDAQGNPIGIPNFNFNTGNAAQGTQYEYLVPQSLQAPTLGEFQLNAGNGSPGAVGSKPTFFEKAFGHFDENNRQLMPGFFEPLTKGVSAIAGIGLGFKQLDQAEEAFDFQKDLAVGNFELNQNTLEYNIGQRAYSAAKLANASDAEAEAARAKAVKTSGVNDVTLKK